MKFEFKKTTWEKVTIPKEKEAEILKGIEDGEITSADDIFDICKDAVCEEIEGVDTPMSIEQNEGFSTIEVRNDEGDIIYENGDEN